MTDFFDRLKLPYFAAVFYAQSPGTMLFRGFAKSHDENGKLSV